jgi:radical SAM protein with 4Fe4S-binding SPASM domain
LWPRAAGRGVSPTRGLTPDELVDLDAQDPDRVGEWTRLAATPHEAWRGEQVYGCGAGRHSFHVDCAGRLSACLMARQPAFDLLALGFQRAWDGGLAAAVSGERTFASPCGACRASTVCNQCPGWSQQVHGDNETAVAFVCELARLRAARFGPVTTIA